jgi:hypothetical protein
LASLEGWPQRIDSLPSFETHRFAMLLRMTSENKIDETRGVALLTMRTCSIAGLVAAPQ